MAIILAQNGVKLCISARRESELESVKKECLENNRTGLTAKDILVLKMDMLEIDRHEDQFKKVLKHFGQLDVLVNNAGRSQRANWETIELKVDHEMFDLDVFSIINLSRIYVRHIEQTTKKGHLVVTSSGAGLGPVPFSGSYVGAKFAINVCVMYYTLKYMYMNLSKRFFFVEIFQGYYSSLKVEKPHIDVTIFCPGPTFTPFLQDAFTDKVGEKYNKDVKATDRRMTSERCGFLMATSIANKSLLSFVGPFPVIMVLYISMYYPNVRLL